MNEALVEGWNRVVGDGDTVFVLGDVTGGSESDLGPVRALAGYKVLVPGNHDRCWDGHAAGRRPDQDYLDAGFDLVLHRPGALDVGGTPCALSHFPYRRRGQSARDHRAWRPFDTGGWLAHGHVHTAWRQRGREINVGVDAWGGRPVAYDELAALIAAGPHERAPLEWRRRPTSAQAA